MKLELAGQILAINAANAEGPTRQVDGIAVPWNVEAVVSSGQRVKFLEGSLPVDGPAPKFIRDHDLSKPLGIVSERVSTPEAMLFSAKISATRDGDEALVLAADGVLDSVSVGVEPLDYDFEGSVMVVKSARWEELSLLPFGAFSSAKVVSVAAAEPEPETQDTPTNQTGENKVSEETTEVQAAQPVQMFAAPRREFKLPSASEYMAAFVRGGADFAQMNANIKAAAPDVTVAGNDVDGLLPLPIVQPIYNNFRGLRPVIDAFGVRQMPAGGKVFIRPVVTTHNSIGSVTENTTITASEFVVNDEQITKLQYGGYVRISEQAVDFSQPEVLAALLDDMSRVYANQVDDVAADALVAGTTNTNNFTAANIADPTDWINWIYTAASDILSDSNGNLPDTIFLAPNRWASLGQLEDGQGRPLFPQIGPMNAFGQVSPSGENGNAFGLRVVVDRNLASGTLLIGSTRDGGFECWEDPRGSVMLHQPSTLSWEIAFRGYFAAKMIDSSKFIKAAFV